MQIRVNGQTVPAPVDSGNWVTLRRLWHDGDRVDARLPMVLATKPFQPGRALPTALVKGPVVLAIQTADGKLPRRMVRDLVHALEPVPEHALHYRIPARPSALVRPFYELGEGSPYFISFDPDAPTRIGHRAVTFHPSWNDGAPFAFTDVIGAGRNSNSREPASAGWVIASMTAAGPRSRSTARSPRSSTSTDRAEIYPSTGTSMASFAAGTGWS